MWYAIAFTLGALAGGAAVYAFDRHGNAVYNLGWNLLRKAEGDFEKAWQHVSRLI
jgi:hypothetical protein